MREPNSTELVPSPIEKQPQPIGEVILGNIDPRTLSYDEFLNSSDLLYHGSLSPLSVDPTFDYNTFLKNADTNGALYGRGLYTTDNPETAYAYGRGSNLTARGPESQDVPVVTPLLPFHARMFDFRDKNDPSKNAPVPQEMVQRFTRKFAESAKKWIEENPTAQGGLWRLNNKLSTLKEWSETNEPVKLVELVSASKTPSLGGWFPEALHETFAELGYDGAIVPFQASIAGFDVESTAVIFYNLEKVGSFKDWQQRTDQDSPAKEQE